MDFHKEHYFQKVGYLKDQFNRMWTRFNFFLTVETALFGGKFFIQSGAGSVQFQWYITIIGFFVSLIWYAIGAEDKYLVDLYRKQVEDEFEKLKGALSLSTESQVFYVGKTEGVSELHLKKSLFRWRISGISITMLAAIIPFLLMITWLVMFLYHRLR